MISILVRHLVESTFLCLLLSAVAFCLCRRAADQYAILLAGVAKFAIPSVLLIPLGARLAVIWPPSPTWLASLVIGVSARLSSVLGKILSDIENVPIAFRVDFVCLWGLGVAVSFLLWLRGIRMAKLSWEAPTPKEQQIFDRARRRLNPRFSVHLYSVDSSSGPALHGFWRSRMVIPKGLSERLSEEEWETVLLHEFAHARRLDNLAAALIHLLRCVFWFHPLLWLVEKQLAITREAACDENVIDCGASPETYIAAIVGVCQFDFSRSAAGVSNMADYGLKQRFDRIRGVRHERRLWLLSQTLVASAVLLMGLVPIAGGYCGQCVSNGQDGPNYLINWSVK